MGEMNTYSKDVIDEKFKGIDEKFEVSNHRIKDLENEMKDTKDLVNAISAVDKKVDLFARDTTNKIDNLTCNVTEIKQYVEEKRKKPAEWVEKLIWLVIAGIAGYLMGFIFK